MERMRLFGWAVLTTAACFAAAAAGEDWTSKKLTNTTGDSFNPAVAAAGSNVYVVWDDDTVSDGSPEIYFMKSSDGGVTWKAPRRLTQTPGVSERPAVAADGSRVFVVWQEYSQGQFDVCFKKSDDGGTTWQPTKRIATSALNDTFPRIAAKGSSLYVVWHSEQPGGQGEEVYFMKSSDGGAAWQAAKNLSNNPGTSWLPVVGVDGSMVFVVWTEWALSNYEVYFTKSLDGGAGWSAGKRLSYNAGSSWYPDIAMDGDRVYVVWGDNTPGFDNNEIFFRKSNDAGAKWLAPKRMTNTPGHSWRPKVAVCGSIAYLVWYDYTPGRAGICLRTTTDKGATWQALRMIFPTTGDSRTPSLATNGSDVVVVWAEWNSTQNNYEIYLASNK